MLMIKLILANTYDKLISLKIKINYSQKINVIIKIIKILGTAVKFRKIINFKILIIPKISYYYKLQINDLLNLLEIFINNLTI